MRFIYSIHFQKISCLFQPAAAGNRVSGPGFSPQKPEIPSLSGKSNPSVAPLIKIEAPSQKKKQEDKPKETQDQPQVELVGGEDQTRIRVS